MTKSSKEWEINRSFRKADDDQLEIVAKAQSAHEDHEFVGIDTTGVGSLAVAAVSHALGKPVHELWHLYVANELGRAFALAGVDVIRVAVESKVRSMEHDADIPWVVQSAVIETIVHDHITRPASRRLETERRVDGDRVAKLLKFRSLAERATKEMMNLVEEVLRISKSKEDFERNCATVLARKHRVATGAPEDAVRSERDSNDAQLEADAAKVAREMLAAAKGSDS